MEKGGFDIISLEELQEDALVVTGSLVGSPSSEEGNTAGSGCIRAYQLFQKMRAVGSMQSSLMSPARRASPTAGLLRPSTACL